LRLALIFLRIVVSGAVMLSSQVSVTESPLERTVSMKVFAT
jgi:hypothetical protein